MPWAKGGARYIGSTDFDPIKITKIVFLTGATFGNSQKVKKEKSMDLPVTNDAFQLETIHFSNLNSRQRTFIDELLICGNPTQSAIKAGYSVKSARNQAHRMMTNDDIKAVLQAKQDQRAKKLNTSQDQIIQNLWTIEGRAMYEYVHRSPHRPAPTKHGNMAIRALYLLGLHYNADMWKGAGMRRRDPVPHNYLSDIVLESLSNEQLDQLEGIKKTSAKWKKDHNIKKQKSF